MVLSTQFPFFLLVLPLIERLKKGGSTWFLCVVITTKLGPFHLVCLVGQAILNWKVFYLSVTRMKRNVDKIKYGLNLGLKL